MPKFRKFVCALCTLAVLMTSCSAEKQFNPYLHLSRMFAITTSEQYSHDREFILSHVSDTYRDMIDSRLSGTIIDPDYTRTERKVYVQDSGDDVRLIVEYAVTTYASAYIEVVYAEYYKEVLVDWYVKDIQPNQFE